MAHVAFADDTALGVELRHSIRAVPDAVLAADAGVGRVQDDPGDGVFRVRIDRAALEAIGIEAMIAAHREIVALRIGIAAAFDLADAPPVNVRGIAVLLIARDLAGAASDALRHVEVKAILLALAKRPARDQQRNGCGACRRNLERASRRRLGLTGPKRSVLGQPHERVVLTICARS